MSSWIDYLRRGMARRAPEDRLIGDAKDAGLWANLANLRPFLAKHWRGAALSTLLIGLGLALSTPQPLVQRYLIDDVIVARDLSGLLPAVIVLAALKLAEKLASMLQRYFAARFEQRMLTDIQQDLLAHALKLPKSFYDENQTGYLMSRLSVDVQGLRWFFSGTLAYTASSALRFIVGVVLLFLLEWRLALVAAVAAPLIAAGMNRFARRLRILRHHDLEKQANVSRQMQESLSLSTLIKAYSSEAQTTGRIATALGEARDVVMEQTTVSSIAGMLVQAIPDLSRALVLAIGGYLVISGDLTLGSLLAFQTYAGWVHGPAQQLGMANLQLQSALAALERVSALYDILPEQELGQGRVVRRLEGRLSFENVSFWYDEREPVLSEVSFDVAPGEHVAIVGRSGVGKTTLISLILRFYRPLRGQILFDGELASDYELRSLRGRIGYVSQESAMLSGTLAENVRYGRPEASDEEVQTAARLAGIHGFVTGLPDGYGTLVGEGGAKLSQGQRQRTALARALLVEPDVLVLDEPTSGLDQLTERSILGALPGALRGKTILTVTHRPSAARHADRVLLLREQRLVDSGTHEELLARSEYYRSLMAEEAAA